MKASDLFVKCLEAEGVNYIFGLPGEEILDLIDSLRNSRLRFISTRHEQGAAFMANAYGRLTGKAGVCLSTLGPGATNLTTGVADATLDHAPLVAITAQAGLERIHKESHQYVDIRSCFAPLTKWGTRVERGQVIPEVIRKAFKIAETERQGACHVELPEDVAKEEVEGVPLPVKAHTYPEPDEAVVASAARLIEAARDPLILAGHGVIRGHAWEAVRRLATQTRIPVVHTFMGKGVLPDDHPLSLHAVGLQAKDYISFGFEKADLIITIGYDHAEYAPCYWNPAGEKKVLHIDFVPAEVDAHYPVAVEVVADIGKTVDLLCDTVRGTQGGTSLKGLKEFIIGELSASSEDAGFPMKPQRVVHELRTALGREDILISDVGAHKIWIARMYPAYEPNTVIISNGYASMGIALPAAITAKLLFPHRKVIAACGDGGFLMTCQEMETARRLGVSCVVLIFNDGGYGLVSWKQRVRFGKEFGATFGNPDYVALARSFGWTGYRVQAASELRPLLTEALAKETPCIVDVPVDYEENFRLTEKLGHLICPL